MNKGRIGWWLLTVTLVWALAATFMANATSRAPIEAKVVCRNFRLTEDSAAHIQLTRYNVGSGGVIHVTYRCVGGW
jgi:hypothetical protein